MRYIVITYMLYFLKRFDVAAYCRALFLALSLVTLVHADNSIVSKDSLRDLPRLVTSVTVQQGEFESILIEYVRWGGETSHQQVKTAFEQFRSRLTELSSMVGHTEPLLNEYRDVLVVDDEEVTADEIIAASRTEDKAIRGSTTLQALASFERTKRLLAWWNGQAKVVIANIGPKVEELQEGDAILHHSMRGQLDSLGDALLTLQLAAFERQGHIDRALERREQWLARQIQFTYMALAIGLVFASVMLGFFLRQKARAAVALHAANEQLQGKVEEANRLAAKLKFNASHDELTGLNNRRSFTAELDRTFADTTQSHAIVFIDLDKFKIVNDTCGHAAGDELLRRIAELLAQQAEGKGMAARFGGDEFVLLLPRCGLGTLRGIAISTCELMSQIDFQPEDQRFPVGGSFGAVLFEPLVSTPSSLMQVVDEACYESKNQGGGCVAFRDLRAASINEKTISNVSPLKKVA